MHVKVINELFKVSSRQLEVDKVLRHATTRCLVEQTKGKWVHTFSETKVLLFVVQSIRLGLTVREAHSTLFFRYEVIFSIDLILSSSYSADAIDK